MTRNAAVLSACLLLAGLAPFLGCAKIQAPPGGPEDKTPPVVLRTIPESGAVNIDRLEPVGIEFSEPMNKDKIADAIYISPRPALDPDYSWDKNTLLIEWRDSLAADITYLVTVAARIADRRGNRLAEPLVMAFATGAAIDSGVVHGRVYSGRNPASSAQVLLFRLPLDSARAIYDIPDYLTETGADGAFEFLYLPRGFYRAVAAVDKNKNRRLDPGEKAGVGAFDIELQRGESAALPLDLYLRDVDTAIFELVRCQVSPDRLLRTEFSHAVDSISLDSAIWVIEPVTAADRPVIVHKDSDFENDIWVRFAMSGMNTGVSYRLKVSGLANGYGRVVDTAANTCEFFWPSAPDTVPPQIIVSEPADGQVRVDYHAPIKLWFSEPVDTTATGTGFFLADSSGVRVEGRLLWPAPWQMVFVPASQLQGGMAYTMALDTGAVADRAGNFSVGGWAARFTTVEPGEFGGIAGSLSVTRTDWIDQPIVLEFIPTEKKLSPVRKILMGPGAFEYEMIAGMYIIQTFVDLNANGRFDNGYIQPFLFAEPRFTFPDTIEVRARFVTDGVSLALP